MRFGSFGLFFTLGSHQSPWGNLIGQGRFDAFFVKMIVLSILFPFCDIGPLGQIDALWRFWSLFQTCVASIPWREFYPSCPIWCVFGQNGRFCHTNPILRHWSIKADLCVMALLDSFSNLCRIHPQQGILTVMPDLMRFWSKWSFLALYSNSATLVH
jgi:hypothetical protein